VDCERNHNAGNGFRRYIALDADPSRMRLPAPLHAIGWQWAEK